MTVTVTFDEIRTLGRNLMRDVNYFGFTELEYAQLGLASLHESLAFMLPSDVKFRLSSHPGYTIVHKNDIPRLTIVCSVPRPVPPVPVALELPD